MGTPLLVTAQIGVLLFAATAWAQDSGAAANRTQDAAGWKTSPSPPPDGVRESHSRVAGRPSITRVTTGSGTLPNDAGQIWREYDIRRYTSRVEVTRPEQSIVDWILRETGTEVWFSEPLGLLSANKEKVRVYHTPQMQAVVSELIDRFVSSEAESYVVSVRMITISSPNWRVKALRRLRPVNVQTPGIEAWLLSKEDAAVLLSDLRKRVDFREHNSPNVLINNGQSQTIAHTRPRSYARSVRLNGNAWPGYELEMGQVEEGFSLQVSPLLSLDRRTIDSVIKIQVDQVEKLSPLTLDVPNASAPRQRIQIHVPQLASWRLHERFRWPVDEVLLISRGIVASPDAKRQTLAGIPNPFTLSPPRADALLLLESKGPTSKALADGASNLRTGGLNYRGRY